MEIRYEALAYITDHHVMTLATMGEQGVWATAVYYAHSQFTLYFLSAAHTRHAQNIAQHAMISAAIHDNVTNWQDIKGIQLEGVCQLIQGAERQEAINIYLNKHTFIQEGPPAMRTALERTNWYKLKPSHLYLIDNSKGFGHRDEIHLP